MNGDAYEITGQAFHNTWAHQRRKRRKEKFGVVKKTYVEESKQQAPLDGTLPKDDVNTESVFSNLNESDSTKRKRVNCLERDTMACNKRITREDSFLDELTNDEIVEHVNESDVAEKQSDNGNNKDFTIREEAIMMKSDESELGKEEEKSLFSFSCTVGTERQFHHATSSEEGRKNVTLSFVCAEGDRNQFHQLFLCVRNKLLGTALQTSPSS